MENQHRQIKGYRELNEMEIDPLEWPALLQAVLKSSKQEAF